jgi:hypothetical protein
MNWSSILLWGFGGTVVLTTVLAVGQGMGLSRMSIPLLLGTMATPDRRRANLIGSAAHFVNGWLFALLYGLTFESWGRATWWLGAALGLLHGLAVLAVLMPLLPSLHPRMAAEDSGPDPTPQLEPPGFLALHYGRGTPLVTLLAHAVYGAVLGAFYTLSRGGAAASLG